MQSLLPTLSIRHSTTHTRNPSHIITIPQRPTLQIRCISAHISHPSRIPLNLSSNQPTIQNNAIKLLKQHLYSTSTHSAPKQQGKDHEFDSPFKIKPNDSVFSVLYCRVSQGFLLQCIPHHRIQTGKEPVPQTWSSNQYN